MGEKNRRYTTNPIKARKVRRITPRIIFIIACILFSHPTKKPPFWRLVAEFGDVKT